MQKEFSYWVNPAISLIIFDVTPIIIFPIIKEQNKFLPKEKNYRMQTEMVCVIVLKNC